MTIYRDKTPGRIRGRKLQRLRAHMMGQDPLCVRCMAAGRVKAWTELDHIKPLDHGGADLPSNMQGLCKDCHYIKTCEDQGLKIKVEIGLDGWPITPDAQPVPHHPNRTIHKI